METLPRTWPRFAFALLLLVLGACQPVTSRPGVATAEGESTLPPLANYVDRPLPENEPVYSLVGRPDFDVADLSSDQRLWYDRLGAAIDNSHEVMLRRVGSDNSYYYGRWLFQYDHALLLGLRTTGDLHYLDLVDDIAQGMRAQLRDGWCGNVARSVDVNIRYGTVVEPDGFSNFRFRESPGRDHCRDTGDLDEGLVHGHLAMLMYAYHVNRHLESPSGIDYGERADFWLEYLREHFEAKWRERSGTAWPAMDFIDHKFCHTYHQMALYHYFVGKRLQADGDDAAAPYLQQALRMTDGMFEVPYVPGQQPGGFVDVSTPLGEAVVYSFGAPGATDVAPTHLEACPMTYARYMLSSVLVLHLEGLDRWDDDIMTKLANGVAHFLIDTDAVADRSEPFAAGVTGSATVAGIPPTEYRERNTAGRFALAPFAAYAAWEASGTLAATSSEVYTAFESDPDDPHEVSIPASMLFVATLDAERE